jgi:hypothetical protein
MFDIDVGSKNPYGSANWRYKMTVGVAETLELHQRPRQNSSPPDFTDILHKRFGKKAFGHLPNGIP